MSTNKAFSQVVAAFRQGRALAKGNDRTDGITYWLHGNAIARFNPNTLASDPILQITLAGFDTLLTRGRLNQILSGSGFSVIRQAGHTCLERNKNPGQSERIPHSFWLSVPSVLAPASRLLEAVNATKVVACAATSPSPTVSAAVIDTRKGTAPFTRAARWANQDAAEAIAAGDASPITAQPACVPPHFTTWPAKSAAVTAPASTAI